MERVIANLRKPKQAGTPATTASLLASSFMVKEVSAQDIADYRKQVEQYLRKYESYLKGRRAIEVLRARSSQLVLAFTNERAGVPAEGVRVLVRFPTDNDFRVWEPSKIPEEPEAPTAPTPPRRRSLLEVEPIHLPSLLRIPNLDRSLGALRDVQPQGNVSAPTIRQGSTIVEFSVKEVLHNLHEDTREYPLVLQFNRPGTWTVPYELHARNLPLPKTGTLTLAVSVRGGDAQPDSAARDDAPTG